MRMRYEDINDLIIDLEYVGFKILEKGDYIIAFWKERNILFFGKTEEILEYYGQREIRFFQQPYKSFDGEICIGFFDNLEDCEDKKTKFPKFSEKWYLWIYKRNIDKEGPYISSMKRIYQFQELYSAIGTENQKIINSVVFPFYAHSYNYSLSIIEDNIKNDSTLSPSEIIELEEAIKQEKKSRKVRSRKINC